MKTHWMACWGGALIMAVTASAAPGFTWKQERGRVALVQTNGTVVWQFNYATNLAMPYFHPVALPEGPPLTWLSPPDHRWHYGLWFAWKYLNGKNYWDFDPKTGLYEGVTRGSSERVITWPDHSARIELDLVYHASGDARPVLRERRTIDVSAPAADGSYYMDWTMAFTAGDGRVVIERTPIPGQPDGVAWGGYAGLTWRFARELTDWQAVNADGVRAPACHGGKSAGCEVNGKAGGREMGVAMLDDPANLHSPGPWYVTLDSATPFACLIAAPIFHQGHALEAGGQFTLRYRVVIHPGRWDAQRLRKAAHEFTSRASSATRP